MREDAVLHNDKVRILENTVDTTRVGSLMIEGGARVITDVLQEKAAGTVIVTIAPVYVGNEGFENDTGNWQDAVLAGRL
ncbi:hypothetical protein G7K_4802-t1 [Saitoella complicata NRRL Y-17804]|uniref:2,5-diamino-6-ribosylamino-4(3H)-pyrimidinone 5'-phosphate reductase n=1 Tax=Saitoella complicata (strain BCRC 22490 / CBS 7301 / JCM 7358 / NBRC 10748 / NRRL Y-17804) TaxID=698492 RepID=A0A0E9NMN0_SAICN|nr:hypothetical protein G7K_4802-t1 [Saitoella complicata NRRL Y-17804]